jgi:CRISPR/Cas system-associated exonuclease Cas4 (RecB family)
MITDLGNGLFWDDSKSPYEQSDEAQVMFNTALATTPQRTYETCLANRRRSTSRTYQFNDIFKMVAIPVYIAPPINNEFMGVSDIIYSLVPNTNAE